MLKRMLEAFAKRHSGGKCLQLLEGDIQGLLIEAEMMEKKLQRLAVTELECGHLRSELHLHGLERATLEKERDEERHHRDENLANARQWMEKATALHEASKELLEYVLVYQSPGELFPPIRDKVRAALDAYGDNSDKATTTLQQRLAEAERERDECSKLSHLDERRTMNKKLSEEIRETCLGGAWVPHTKQKEWADRVSDLVARLQQAERERDEAVKLSEQALAAIGGIAGLARHAQNTLELRAMRALLSWVRSDPSRCIGNCCGELGAFTVHHASADDEISEDGRGPTAEDLADTLGLKWR